MEFCKVVKSIAVITYDIFIKETSNESESEKSRGNFNVSAHHIE